MEYVGKWSFHSVGQIDESGALVYMNAEEHLASPMTYIDETDEEAVADEIKARKQTVGSYIEVCDNGEMYLLVPVPDGVTQEELDEAVASGEIDLRNGMLCQGPLAWQERDGKLWYDSGIEGEVFGEKADTWACGIDENGFLNFMNIRYSKED